MELKNVIVLLLFILTVFGCNQKITPVVEDISIFKNLYEDQLDEGSEYLISFGNIMVEKTKDGKYIRKQFYPETKQMTHYNTFSDLELNVKDGPAKEWWDNGALSFEGQYENNLPTGIWKEYQIRDSKSYSIGEYKKGLPEGVWKVLLGSGMVVEEKSFLNGKRHGYYKIFSEDGRLLEKGIYENGNLTNQEIIDSETVPGNKEISIVDEMPFFQGCDNILDNEKRRECGENKMLVFIYSNIKYPAEAREKGIEGIVISTFTIDKKGKVVNIEVPRGISKDIKNEVVRVLKLMPNWIPGFRNNIPVKVNLTLPVRFKLE